ncbi:MAG TPA: hypothetical protein VIK72_19495 [Clostridiaceae bacterium]
MNAEKERLFDKFIDMVYVKGVKLTFRQGRVLRRLSDEKGIEMMKELDETLIKEVRDLKKD